jgi:SAM-dependent methyltransferase
MAHHICPWWMGYVLASPLRRLWQNPKKILGPYVRPGMTALDVGPGMGFFSLPLARMVGPDGRVVCVDIQPQMIDSLRRRAKRDRLLERMDLRICDDDSLGLDDLTGRVDLALGFAVAHEMPDVVSFVRQIHAALAPGGRFLLAEPAGRVQPDEFNRTVHEAEEAGFAVIDRPDIKRSRSVVLQRRDGNHVV